MKRAKRPAPPFAARAAAPRAALTAAALLAVLLTGCVGPTASGAAPAEGGTAQPTPAPSAAPAAEAYIPGPQPGFEKLPPDARFTLTYTDPDTLESETRLLQGGEMLPAGNSWVADVITGETAARAERRTEAGEEQYLLYDLEGNLLLDCGRLQPAGIFGSYAILGRWILTQEGGDSWLEGQFVDLSTGEVWQDDCRLSGEVSQGVWLVTGIRTAEAAASAPMLVNEQMEVLHRFDGAYDGWVVTRDWSQLPGIVELAYHTEEDTGDLRLYSLARDELFPGEYRGLVAGDAALGCFAVGQEEVLIRLDTGEVQTDPQTVDAWQQYHGDDTRQRYTAITSEAIAYHLTTEKGESRGICLETADGVLSGASVELLPCGWYLRKNDGTNLVLDPAGRQLETLPGAIGCDAVGWPDRTLAVLCGEGGWRLYNTGGLCAEGSADSAWLSAFSDDRCLLYTRKERNAAYALLNAEGEMLLEGLDEIEATEVPGVWSVRRGDSVGLMDETGSWLWVESVSVLFAPQEPALPKDARCALPGTNVSDPMLLLGDTILPDEGDWVLDRASGRVMGRRETVREGDGPSWCRLYGLEGELLLDDARVAGLEVLGRWAFVQTGRYDYGDGWAVNLDTGETRFRGCRLGGEAAPGVFIVNHAADADPLPTEAPCLVDGQLQLLRAFEGFTAVSTHLAGLNLPGYLILTAADGSFRLYEVARDEILPGELLGILDPQQGLVQLRTGQGTAVYALETRSPAGEWDDTENPRGYIAYAPDFALYRYEEPRYRRNEYCLERQSEGTRIRYAGYTAAGYYAEQLDGSAQLLNASGELLQTREPHAGSRLINTTREGGSTLPCFTLRSYNGGYELLGQNGPLMRGETAGYAELCGLAEDRYALCVTEYDQSKYTLLDTEGTVLLSGLDQILSTELPGVWAVQKGFEVGLMDETGSWLFCRDVTPAAAG